jgi:hypothetical protein
MLWAQPKKPTIMVVPSDAWCHEHGFMLEYDNQGSTVQVPDYKKALQESPDLLLVISKINELMAERGFPLKNLESTLKMLERQSAEDAMLMSDMGGTVNESPIDMLKKTAKADIWMQMTWSVNKMGPKKSVTFNLQGIDAYTNKQIAGTSGTGTASFSSELPVLLEEAVVENLDHFNAQLQQHFEDLIENGREILLRIKVWDTFDGDLATYYGPDDYELGEIIENWVYDNAVNGRYSTTIYTDNMLVLEQVRMPLYDDRGRPTDARRWVRDLRRHLRSAYDIDAKLMMQGLGQASLIIGEK